MLNKWKKNKGPLSIFIVILFLFNMAPLAAYGATSDIAGHWAGDVISQWLDKGLAKGYPDGTFRPGNDISRAEFMALVNNAFEFTAEEDIDFKDVEEGKWYVATVKRAKAAGYIGGFPDGTIKPNSFITRQEVAVIIARLKTLALNEGAADAFSDVVEIGSWSKGAVGAVMEAGYMSGYPDGGFGPQNNIKRAEAIFALNNVINNQITRRLVAKQDFLGITYIQVEVNKAAKPTAVKANGQELAFDSEDGKWKGTSLDFKIGDKVEILIIEGGEAFNSSVTVEDILD